MYLPPPDLKLVSPSKLFGQLKLGDSISIKPNKPSSRPANPTPKINSDTPVLSAVSVMGMSLANIIFTEAPLPFDTTQPPLSISESLGITNKISINSAKHQISFRQFLSQIDSHLDTNSELKRMVSSMRHGNDFIEVLNKSKTSNLSKDDINSIQRFLSRSAGYDLNYNGHRTGIDGNYGDKTHKALQLFFKNPSEAALSPLAIDNPYDSGVVMGVAKGTGYYPHNSAMEGGFVDKRDTALRTLQDFLAGKAEYVSVALDKNLYKKGTIQYGDKFRIPELEAKYGRVIEFRAVDTGGAFTNKRFNRIDICTGGYRHSIEPTVNGQLTLIKLD